MDLNKTYSAEDFLSLSGIDEDAVAYEDSEGQLPGEDISAEPEVDYTASASTIVSRFLQGDQDVRGVVNAIGQLYGGSIGTARGKMAFVDQQTGQVTPLDPQRAVELTANALSLYNSLRNNTIQPTAPAPAQAIRTER